MEMISPIMSCASRYSAVETLRDGRRLEIRAFKPGNTEMLESAVARTSVVSLYRRFFTIKRDFTEREREFLLNVDFVNHVALVAVTAEAGRCVIVGGGRYVVVKQGEAEVAFVVIDEYQGQGVGTALMRHLIDVARAAGMRRLVADVLAENISMLKVFKKSGFPMQTIRESETVHVVLRID